MENAESKHHSPFILVIDDEVFIRDIIRMHLEAAGYRVTTAENGREGFEQLLQQPPDAVICDVLMPQEDGIAFCRRVRALRHTTPILFLSAKNNSECVAEGLAAGADDYLVKPFHLDELTHRVARLISPEKRA